MSGSGKRILVMAGGTGGHVFPAIAIADALKARGHEILWLGSRGRMEEKLVPKHGYPIAYIKVHGVRRNGLKTKLLAPFMIMRALWEALGVVRSFKPDLALGMGGYASGPGGLAAFLCRVPVVLHEQNAAAGLTNRLLFRIARRTLLGFPGAFEGRTVTVVGNPVRAEIAALHERPKAPHEGPLRVLVIGGSLGAQALNRLVPAAVKLIPEGEIEVTHQCGAGNSAEVSRAYEGAASKHEVSDFIDDMAAAYSTHDLLIARAGAGTVSEAACAGIPAIFVPLPSAVDDHQTKNARFLEKKGGAFICPQATLTPEALAERIESLAKDREKLESMREASLSCAITDSAQRCARIIEEAAR
jgi:UDP-N-acetylglucosamine--N-acetylmuramyl-(pentapeptide) pyrophosphoryl-undecaprenol N-acetylglucosamine transferase